MRIEQPNEFGMVDMKEMIAFEQENEIKLPQDYKAFLIENNGGKPVYEGNSDGILVDWFYGFHEGPAWSTIYYAIDVFHSRIPSWFFPIGCDPFGNQYLMSLYEGNYGLVAFWDHEKESKGNASQYFDNMRIIGDSFSEFLTKLAS